MNDEILKKIKQAFDEEIFAREGCECCGGGYSIEGKEEFFEKVKEILKAY